MITRPSKNKKKHIVLLLALVLCIWGIIIYQIIHTSSVTNNDRIIKSEEIEKSSFVPDSLNFEIKLNYKDPFISSKKNNPEVLSSKNKSKPLKRIVKSTSSGINITKNLKYHGSIIGKNKQIVALVSQNHKYHKLMLGDQIKNLKLIYLNKDSIGLIYKNAKLYIKKE